MLIALSILIHRIKVRNLGRVVSIILVSLIVLCNRLIKVRKINVLHNSVKPPNPSGKHTAVETCQKPENRIQKPNQAKNPKINNNKRRVKPHST